jgi:hypothetical protein
MSVKKGPFRIRWLLVAIVLLAIAGAAVAVADPDESTHPARRARVAAFAPCGKATLPTVAAVDVHVAKRIYAGEVDSAETAKDRARIVASRELVGALAAGNRSAVYAAVHAIVYTPHWHIVRLRVVKDGHVLADVGGPYIIAPVDGTLREGARKLGGFVMSVQDDVGYVKLVTRFTGVPIDLYGTPRPADGFVLGTLRPAPVPPRDGATVEVRGVHYLARVISARAFPAGPLRAVLLVASPPHALAARSCQAVRRAAWENVLEHVAARLAPLPSHYQELAGTARGATGGLVFVRTGSKQIAGLGKGPRHLPSSGPVSYRGRTWQVLSWEPYPPARIYFLTPW